MVNWLNTCVVLFLVHDRDNDLTPIEGGQLSNNKVCSGHSSNRCANNSNNNNGNNNNNVGGPLMSAVAHLNGQVSGMSSRGLAGTSSHTGGATSSNSIVFSAAESCNPLPSLTTSNPFNHFSGNMDLEFELFPSSTWDLDSSSGWADRPESRASGPPNSRPSSQPAPTSPSPQGTFSNSAVAPHCSPLRAFSPTSANAAHTFSNSFSLSPLQESTSSLTNSAASSSVSANGAAPGLTPKRQDEGKSTATGCPTTANQSVIEGNNARTNPASVAGTPAQPPTAAQTTATVVETQNSVVSTESGRLRNLLTKGGSASEETQDNTSNDTESQNKHRILKILLNQQDEDDFHPEHNNKVRTSPSNMPKPSMEHSKSSLGNNMLLQVNHSIIAILFPSGLVVSLAFLKFSSVCICRSADMSKKSVDRSIRPSISIPYVVSRKSFFLRLHSIQFICFKLLNEKNDDEDEEARAGLKKRNELLQQLLKDQDDERKVQEQHVSNRIFRTVHLYSRYKPTSSHP